MASDVSTKQRAHSPTQHIKPHDHTQQSEKNAMPINMASSHTRNPRLTKTPNSNSVKSHIQPIWKQSNHTNNSQFELVQIAHATFTQKQNLKTETQLIEHNAKSQEQNTHCNERPNNIQWTIKPQKIHPTDTVYKKKLHPTDTCYKRTPSTHTNDIQWWAIKPQKHTSNWRILQTQFSTHTKNHTNQNITN